MRFCLQRHYFTVASNTAYQILGRFLSSIIAVLTTRMITKSLGIEGYGEYQIVLNYASFLWILTDFGLNAIFVRRLAETPQEKKQSVFSYFLSSRIILGVFLTISLCLVSFFLPYRAELRWLILFSSLTVITQTFRGSASAIFQFRLRYDLQFWGELIGSLIFLPSVYAVLQYGGGVAGLVWTFILQYTVVAVFFWISSRKWFSFSPQWNKEKIFQLFRETFPFGLALALNLFITKQDNFWLSLLPQKGVLPQEAVGHYSLGLKIFEFVLAVPTFFMNVVYPILAKNLVEDKNKFKSIFKQSSLILLAGAIGGAIPLYFLSPIFIQIFAQGVDIQPAVSVLRVFTLFTPIYFLTSILMWTLIVFKKQKKLIMVYGLGLIISCLGNFILIPRYSYLGATVTRGLAEIVILIQLIFLVRREMKKI